MRILLFLFISINVLFAENIINAFGSSNESLYKAKESSLQNLSNKIFSEVTTSTDLELYNDSHFSYQFAMNRVKIKNTLVLHNVKFLKYKANKDFKFRYKAVFTRDTLNSTVSYLKSLTDIKLYSNMSEKDLIEQRKKLDNLYILQPYLKSKKKRLDLARYIRKRFSKINNLLNMGSVQIIFGNLNIDYNVNVIIDDKVYYPNKKIYLKEGKHFYLIKTDTYNVKSGSFFVTKQNNVVIEEFLYPKHSYFFNLKINNKLYEKHITEHLDNNFLSIDNFSKHKNNITIDLSISENKKLVYGVKLNNLYMNIRGRFNNKTISVKKCSKQNVYLQNIYKDIDDCLYEFIDIFYMNLENDKGFK